MSHACPAGHRIVQNIYFQRQDLLLVQNLSCKEHCPCARSIYIEMIFHPATIITILSVNSKPTINCQIPRTISFLIPQGQTMKKTQADKAKERLLRGFFMLQ